jgi:FKBP-type peptidyl-prolyl cis-trans isomerase
LKPLRVAVDYDAFMKGFSDAAEGRTPRITEEAAGALLNKEFTAAVAKVNEANLAAAQAFMSENGKRAGVITTKSGLEYEVIKEGTGPKPNAGSTVRVNYTGKLTNDTEFDRNRDNKPAEFPLSQVIPGWSEGLALMSTGAHYRLYIPPALAYGERSPTPKIPPNSVLVFDVELVEIK